MFSAIRPVETGRERTQSVKRRVRRDTKGCVSTQELGVKGRKCWVEVMLADKNGEYRGMKEVKLWRTGN